MSEKIVTVSSNQFRALLKFHSIVTFVDKVIHGRIEPVAVLTDGIHEDRLVRIGDK
jgi:hypothetical protein